LRPIVRGDRGDYRGQDRHCHCRHCDYDAAANSHSDDHPIDTNAGRIPYTVAHSNTAADANSSADANATTRADSGIYSNASTNGDTPAYG
jgi:hypothetical protein